jgi:hypothetical protein
MPRLDEPTVADRDQPLTIAINTVENSVMLDSYVPFLVVP